MSAKNSSELRDQLKQLIQENIETNGQEFEDHVWLVCNAGPMSVELGISSKAFTNLINYNEFEFVVRQIGESPKSYWLRVKKPDDPPSIPVVQRKLAKIWTSAIPKFNSALAEKCKGDLVKVEHNIQLSQEVIAKLESHAKSNAEELQAAQNVLLEDLKLEAALEKKLKRAEESLTKEWKVGKKEFGCLRGLVVEWGVSQAPSLFAYVLDHWPEFMMATKHAIYSHGFEDEGFSARYYDYPNIAYIRLFHMAVHDMILMDNQSKGIKSKLPASGNPYKLG